MPLSIPTLPVGPTQVSNNTVNVLLSRFSRLANQAPKVGLSICRINPDVRGGNSYTRRINVRSRLSGVDTFTVGENAPEARSTLTPSTITGALRGLMTFLRDDAIGVSFENELEVNRQQLDDAYRHFWHLEVLELFSSITATSGDATTIFDLETWDAFAGLIAADYWAVGRKWAVLHGDAIRDLKGSLRAAGGSIFASTFGERKATELATTQPELGIPFEDFTLYRSNDVPAGDTTGWTNAAGVLTENEESALALDVYMESRVEYQRDAPAVGQVQVISGIAGCGVQAQGNCRAQISRT